jgi:hypothetical protein
VIRYHWIQQPRYKWHRYHVTVLIKGQSVIKTMQILNEYTETMNTWIHSLDYDLIQRTNYSTQIPKISLYVSETRLLPIYRDSATTYYVLFLIHNEQTTNGLWKIVWASIFRFPFETATYIYVCILYIQNKRKFAVSVCFLQTENGSLFSLVSKR